MYCLLEQSWEIEMNGQTIAITISPVLLYCVIHPSVSYTEGGRGGDIPPSLSSPPRFLHLIICNRDCTCVSNH